MNILGDDEDVIKTDILKARGNTLVFYNTIYQISNISEIRTINLSTENSMPQFYWVFLLIGIGSLVPLEPVFILVGLFLSLIHI